jgi:hypothetical protein
MTMLCATLNIGIMEVKQRALPTPYGILDLTSKFCNQVIASVLMLSPRNHPVSKPKTALKFSDAIDHQQPKDVDPTDLVIDGLGHTLDIKSTKLFKKQSLNYCDIDKSDNEGDIKKEV